jgi:Mg-chelatase subunit ChlD
MRHSSVLLGAAVALLSWLPAAPAAGPPAAKKKARPKVEVVFCLDTTGSMTGLIQGAKDKIWAICNQIASGKPTPELKVGLVAYRDRGDAYVTQVTDLTDDLDAVHARLKTFKAAGGGDVPESVNQALDDAVHKVKWSKDKRTLRIVFLVGDAPPHMDYDDDVKYPATCKEAVEKGIIINTIQCGKLPACTTVWKDVARRSEGSYAAIEQGGGVVTVKTPYDEKLAELNRELTKTVLVYGSRETQLANSKKNDAARGLGAGAAAERIAYQAKNAQAASYCLLDAVQNGRVKLEDVKKDELPDELKKLRLKEQKAYLDKLAKKRAGLNKQVLELDKKRLSHIDEKNREAAKKGRAGFDAQVLEMLRGQAKKFDIKY